MDAATFRTLGHHLVEQIADLLAAIPDRPVTRDESPSVIREALDLNGALPEQGADAAALLAEAARLFEHSLFNGHPRFFGYITVVAGPDWYPRRFSRRGGESQRRRAGALSPAATEIEAQTVRWIAELIGYPADCGGLLVSGGNMANIVCLLAARAAGAGWDVRAEGVGGGRAAPAVALLLRGDAHLDSEGRGSRRARHRRDPLDSDRRPRCAWTSRALTRAIDRRRAAGELPFLVVGTAGSVSTGAVDPLPEIAAICRERRRLVPRRRRVRRRSRRRCPRRRRTSRRSAGRLGRGGPAQVAVRPARSRAARWCATRTALRATFAYHPPYYHFGEQATNYVDFGPQNSRGFRALKVWLALRQAGARRATVRMIADDIALSRRWRMRFAAHPELELPDAGA